jgi:cytochrome c551/c552
MKAIGPSVQDIAKMYKENGSIVAFLKAKVKRSLIRHSMN